MRKSTAKFNASTAELCAPGPGCQALLQSHQDQVNKEMQMFSASASWLSCSLFGCSDKAEGFYMVLDQDGNYDLVLHTVIGLLYVFCCIRIQASFHIL